MPSFQESLVFLKVPNEENFLKIYSICTPSHRVFRDEWFLPSLCDPFPVEILDAESSGDGTIGNEGFNIIMLQKVRLILRAIEEQWGSWFIYSDVDVQFFRPLGPLAQKYLMANDICFQRDSPTGELCAGLFAACANDNVRRLWRNVEHHLEKDLSRHDQTWLNTLLDPKEMYQQARFFTPVAYLWQTLRLLRLSLKTHKFCSVERWARLRLQSLYGVRIGLFPDCVFGAGTSTGLPWSLQQPFPVPSDACVHHANYAVGTQAKLEQFRYVKLKIVQFGESKISDNPETNT